MVDGFPVNIDKSQAVTSLATEKIFKADRIKPLNNCKAGFFIQLWLEVFPCEKEQDRTFIPILWFYARE